MGPTNVRRVSETERVRGSDRRSRRWLAVVLALTSVCVAYWIFSQDTEWEGRRSEFRLLGLSAEANGNYVAGRRYYESALANHPYDWETHLSLARILDHRLNDYSSALRHYLYVLAYCPEPAINQQVRSEVELLEMVRRGELENPRDALEDMFMAVEQEAKECFFSRLSPRLRDSLSSYWKGWNARGRGEMVYSRIRDENNGFYDANVELVYPDSTSMSMHLYCVKGHVWRLEVSFP